MFGRGYFNHLGKDNFEITDIGNGRDLKKFKVKMLKRDMVEILKKYGRDNTGKKDEVLQKFIKFISKAPKTWKPEPKPEPVPRRQKYVHRFSDVGYNSDRYAEDDILSLMADENSPDYETEEQRQIKRLSINKIASESRNKNKDFIGNWIINGERYNSKTGEYHALKRKKSI